MFTLNGEHAMQDTALSGPGRISRTLEESAALVVVVVLLLLLVVGVSSPLPWLFVVVVGTGSKPNAPLMLVTTILPALSPETKRLGAKVDDVTAVTSLVWQTCSSTKRPVVAFHTQIFRSLPPEARRNDVDGCCEKDTPVIFFLWPRR